MRSLDGHYGPHMNERFTQQLSDLSDRVWLAFDQLTDTEQRRDNSTKQHAATRLNYISRSTSVAIRLNSSWALSVPAMALLRVRYEQAVRLSWLARQADNSGFSKLLLSFFSIQKKIYENTEDAHKDYLYSDIEELPSWLTEKWDKTDWDFARRWERQSILEVVRERDKFNPLSEAPISQEKLSDFYNPIYRQFSSAVHTNMHSTSLVGIYVTSNGLSVLAPDPRWPSHLLAFNAILDIIQIYETSIAFFDVSIEKCQFVNAFLVEWKSILEQARAAKAL